MDFIHSPWRLVLTSILFVPLTALGFFILIRASKTYQDIDFDSWGTRCRIAILFIGTLPLMFYLIAVFIGLTVDPNPNLVGPGLILCVCALLGWGVEKIGEFWNR